MTDKQREAFVATLFLIALAVFLLGIFGCSKPKEVIPARQIQYTCYSLNTPYRLMYQTQDGIKTYTISTSNYSGSFTSIGNSFSASVDNIDQHSFDTIHIQMTEAGRQANAGLSFSNAHGSVRVTQLQLQ